MNHEDSPKNQGRREVLKGALGTGVLAAGAVTAPNLLFPALAQGEHLSPLPMMPPKHFNGDQLSQTQLIGRIRERSHRLSLPMKISI